MEYAKLGDIIELSNGLKMKVCKDKEDKYKTVDIETGKDVTTEISNMSKYYVGKKVYGYGIGEYKIVNILNEKLEKNIQTFIMESLPFVINFKITDKNKNVTYQTVDTEDLRYKVILNGNTTIVILKDGCKGVAKCLPDDKYDRDIGINIAYKKALIKSYKKELNKITK